MKPKSTSEKIIRANRDTMRTKQISPAAPWLGALLISIIMLASCSKDALTPSGGGGGSSAGTVTYRSLTINKVECDTVDAVGGIVVPKVDYTYIKVTTKNGSESEQKMNTGAKVVFSVTGEGWKIDEQGNVSAVANQTTDFLKANLDVTVTIGNEKAQKKHELVQRASEDRIVDASYCMLPIWIEEHQCAYPMTSYVRNSTFKYKDNSFATKEHYYISEQKNGKLKINWEEVTIDGYESGMALNYKDTNPEYIGAAGTQIRFHGGEYAQVVTYLSGKKDTTIVEEPKYTVSTKYEFIKGERYTESYTYAEGITGYRTAYRGDDKKASPKSSLNGNVWTISKIGNVEVKNVSHTLTAQANGMSTSLTLNQNDNFVTETLNDTLIWRDPEIYCNRTDWPDIADYPVGSDPKWLVYDGAWWSEKDNRDLHPDGNRFVDIRAIVHYIHYKGAWKFYSGSQEKPCQAAETFSAREDKSMRPAHGFKMTAKADVKMKDGSVKHVSHVSEWPGLKIPKTYKSSQPYLTIELPVVENAAEDFQWTITIDFNMEEDDYYLVNGNVYLTREQTNIDEYGPQWKKIKYQIWDRLTKISDWEKAVKFGGFVHTSCAPTSMADNCLGDIIDGKVNEYSDYYLKYYQYL